MGMFMSFYKKHHPFSFSISFERFTAVQSLNFKCVTILPQAVAGKGERKPLSRRGFFPCLFPSSPAASVRPNDLSYPVMAPTKKQISPRQRKATAALGYLVYIKRFGGLGEKICPLLLWPHKTKTSRLVIK